MTEIDYKKIVSDNSQYMDHTEEFYLVLQEFDQIIQKKLNYPIVEVGTNLGGSALSFLQVIKERNCQDWFYTIDPYGSIPYHDGGGLKEKSVYDNKRYRSAIKLLSNYCCENDLNHYHFKCTSSFFICHLYPMYQQSDNGICTELTNFSFVYLDGSHDIEVIRNELNFFLDKLAIGGMVIVDDTAQIGNQIDNIIKLRDDKKQLKCKGFLQRYAIEKVLLEEK